MEEYLIKPGITIKEAMKKMDIASRKILFVVNDFMQLIGSLTDGDIRRAILRGISLSEDIEKIMNCNPYYVNENYYEKEIEEKFIQKRFEAIPILNKEKKIVKIIFWSDFFSKSDKIYEKLNIPVVIMAGGMGTRLEPFTKILPKPLIPIGDQAIIEIIINEYLKYSIKDFYISVNYKAKLIKAFFEDKALSYNVFFIEESKPLGTVGALKYLENKITSSFFVSNCDIVIKANYSDILNFHKEKNFSLTLVGSVQHYKIPYGICEIDNDGNLIKINEKPEYDFLVNTGMYVMEADILRYIPDNTFFNMTDLITMIQNHNLKIGVYPVSERSWIDIGQWEEYKKNISLLTI